jgi:DNA (cytosine-5)-methyltransferase 1
MPAIAFHVTQDPISSSGATPALGCGNALGCGTLGVMAPTLTATNDLSRSPQSTEVTNQVAAVHAASMAVRRLTPRECERLQGFPDFYTAIPGAKDGPRYRALGNSMAVPVMRWIGERIQLVDDITSAKTEAA